METTTSSCLKQNDLNDHLNTSLQLTSAELDIPYAVAEIIVAICAILGNGLVIIVFSKEKKLRRRTNYYIISLATADLLVGLFAIPFAILASIGLPTNFHACLFTVSVLIVLCTISIFCLVAVSVDRYWAILYPMGYSRNVRTKTAIGIICVCWIAGTLVGFLPLLGWNAGYKSEQKCIFVKVMDYDYLVFLYFATIIFPALLIAAFYAHIYRIVLKQLQQMITINPGKRKKEKNQTSGTMLRLLGAAKKREVKATQNLSRIVLFFIICWFPLYTINCVQAFCPNCDVNEVVLNFCIILSHLNSVGNPLLYAYHLRDFRAALKSFIHRVILRRKEKPKVSNIIARRNYSVGNQKYVRHSLDPSQVINNPRINLIRSATDPSIQTRRMDSIPVSIIRSPIISPVSTPAYKKDAEVFWSTNFSPNSNDLSHHNRSQPKNNPSVLKSPDISKTLQLSAIELQIYNLTNVVKYANDSNDDVIFNQNHPTSIIPVDISNLTSSKNNLSENSVNVIIENSSHQ
ncbi:adenosine receptor A2b-like [Chelonus insularis]|uniref:adenosine receptor A2b-like n=1 Tax=Chelonus insularis TaxID=460826 RepID=UPI00158E8C11|nr:adenosine receptor A2b-like [Chelonus insularis]